MGTIIPTIVRVSFGFSKIALFYFSAQFVPRLSLSRFAKRERHFTFFNPRVAQFVKSSLVSYHFEDSSLDGHRQVTTYIEDDDFAGVDFNQAWKIAVGPMGRKSLLL